MGAVLKPDLATSHESRGLSADGHLHVYWPRISGHTISSQIFGEGMESLAGDESQREIGVIATHLSSANLPPIALVIFQRTLNAR